MHCNSAPPLTAALHHWHRKEESNHQEQLPPPSAFPHLPVGSNQILPLNPSRLNKLNPEPPGRLLYRRRRTWPRSSSLPSSMNPISRNSPPSPVLLSPPGFCSSKNSCRSLLHRRQPLVPPCHRLEDPQGDLQSYLLLVHRWCMTAAAPWTASSAPRHIIQFLLDRPEANSMNTSRYRSSNPGYSRNKDRFAGAFQPRNLATALIRGYRRSMSLASFRCFVGPLGPPKPVQPHLLAIPYYPSPRHPPKTCIPIINCVFHPSIMFTTTKQAPWLVSLGHLARALTTSVSSCATSTLKLYTVDHSARIIVRCRHMASLRSSRVFGIASFN
ncbi:hypothetical protein AUP68_12691 [Ilyonectria robusta]